jgi:very-short-patch-repair endonuclease
VGFFVANERARQLRKQMPPQEVKLWVNLRSWRSRGFHFRRQAPREGFIVDFVCVKQGLVVEVDGGQHGLEMHARRDAGRDERLSQQGFRVLRFWNSDVDRNLEGVLETIEEALLAPTPALRADPSPPGGG